MYLNVTKDVEFDFELVDNCPDIDLVVSVDGNSYTILTIAEDGVVTYRSDEVIEAGLLDSES